MGRKNGDGKWLWHECIVVDSSKVGSNDDSNYSFLSVSLSQSISGLGPSKVGLSLSIRWLLLQMKVWDFFFFMQIIIKIYQGKNHLLNLKIADWWKLWFVKRYRQRRIYRKFKGEKVHGDNEKLETSKIREIFTFTIFFNTLTVVRCCNFSR